MSMIGKLPNPAQWVPPKPGRPEAQALKTHRVDTVRQIVDLALGHGMESVRPAQLSNARCDVRTRDNSFLEGVEPAFVLMSTCAAA